MSENRSLSPDAIASPRLNSPRFDKLKRAPALNVIGLPELIGLAGAALLALLVIFAYFYFYLPARSHLLSAQSDRARLEALRQTYGVTVKENQSTRESVDRINASLRDFESNWLPVQSSGRMSLYTVLNNLIKSNGLRNTAGPSYSPLENLGAKQQVQPTLTAEKQSYAKWQSIYPGIAVSVTVEGPYQNVRHFVRDIETSRQFLIINAVELERVTQSGAAQDLAAGPEEAGGKGGRALVSLRLDLATYFQRPETKGVTP
jgi:type II secretion system (T2SS) protein M